MSKDLNKIIKSLPKNRQAKVAARSKQLVTEELTLRDIRKARKMTQERMAEILNIGQDGVSRLEKRSDLLLSTLESYVRAMGGSLSLIAKFPDRPDVALKGLGLEELSAISKSQKTKKSLSRNSTNR